MRAARRVGRSPKADDGDGGRDAVRRGLRRQEPRAYQRPQRLPGERAWQTRAGTVDLRVPKLRQGRDCPALLEPLRRTAETAPTAVILEASV